MDPSWSNFLRRLRALTLAMGCLLCAAQAPPGDPVAHKTVLVLFSSIYEGRQKLSLTLNEALKRGSPTPLDIYNEFTGLDRFAGPASEAPLVDLYQARYGSRKVDLLVAVGPLALDFAIRNRFLPEVPVVACQVGDTMLNPARERRPNLTGLLPERGSPRTVDLMLALFPATRHILVVLGASAFERRLAMVGRTLAAPYAGRVAFEFLNDLTMEQIEARVRNLSSEDLVFFGSLLQDASGRDFSALDPLARISTASRRPVFGLYAEDLGSGIVGGVLDSATRAGETAAALGLRVLAGEPAGSIPFAKDPGAAPAFDWRELERWGIAPGRLPAGSVVRFRQPDPWSLYWKQILAVFGVLLAETLLVAALVAQLQRRKRTERALAAAEQRYRTVAEFTHDWEFWQRLDGAFEFISPSCERISGQPPRAFLDDPGLMERLVEPEDLERWREHRAEALAGRGDGPFAFRIRVLEAQRWVEQIDYPVRFGDTLAGNRGSIRDISGRKQAELILSQSAEQIRTLKDRLEADNTFYRAKIDAVEPSDELLGQSGAMKYLLFRIQQVAPSDSTVLIQGETGTGKELVAEAIHRLGPRRDAPLIKVNCATLPAALAESELFGHERGAFTGAHAQRKGRFELADGATLFLDEVGELSLEVQAKLLRVLQNGEFQRVGGDRSLRVDARVIAATNRDLGREVAGGRFREDLWYRINVFPISVPPLRNRQEDIPELAVTFVRRFCQKLGRPELALSNSVLQAFQAYAWPGNVRELENVIERAVLISEHAGLRLAEPLAVAEAPRLLGPLKDRLMAFEREEILRVLGSTGGRIEGALGAARVLGLSPSTLRSRLVRLGIERPSE